MKYTHEALSTNDPSPIPMKYTHGALSTNDPSPIPMKYFTREEAEAHANLMNALIDSWEENTKGFWNKDHWRVKPEPWVVKELA